MKLNENFMLRQVAGTWVVLPLTQKTLDFHGMIRLNESGALLWQCLEQGGDRGALVKLLTGRYDVTQEQAEQDVEEFLQTLKKTGCLEV